MKVLVTTPKGGALADANAAVAADALHGLFIGLRQWVRHRRIRIAYSGYANFLCGFKGRSILDGT